MANEVHRNPNYGMDFLHDDEKLRESLGPKLMEHLKAFQV